MDFLDPKKRRAHTIRLFIGYIFISIAILLGTVVLMFLSYGFGLGKDGDVVQNGLLFVSSTPSGANIYLNGKLMNAKTNTRLSIVSGTYRMEIQRAGYRSWQQVLNLEGGSIEHYDYPFLFPVNLATKPVKSYDSAPGLVTQSPDRRWLLIERPDSLTTFDVYDLKNPTVPPVVLTVPASLLSAGSAQGWSLVEWSTDNQHVLLQHNYDGNYEFIMVDRNDPTKSVNLDTELHARPTKVTLLNKKYDQYYLYDEASKTLTTASLNNPTPTAFLSNVISYKSYGDNIMLYASDVSDTPDKVAINLYQDGKTYHLRDAAANTTYLLNITQYSGDWYAAIGASSEDKVYVYKNPVSQLRSKRPVLVPVYVLKAKQPTYLEFSDNARLILDEGGSQFAVFDAENEKGYLYNAQPLDAPQTHADWMDGHRLDYISGGKLVVFDFDHANVQTLMAGSPEYMPAFDTDYKYVYDLTPDPTKPAVRVLTSTALRLPADM